MTLLDLLIERYQTIINECLGLKRNWNCIQTTSLPVAPTHATKAESKSKATWTTTETNAETTATESTHSGSTKTRATKTGTTPATPATTTPAAAPRLKASEFCFSCNWACLFRNRARFYWDTLNVGVLLLKVSWEPCSGAPLGSDKSS
eukprot:Protomagalhaensia_wolfi_Nauph_80__2903@NODE_2990_length_924_cov_48_242938_g2343_i0_p2_GENE_NODE_2990_length_924_cov_48_242938_g2343_i0NODE_2990_length_924_cov_48_242938_g2343_i0_p2_ORF_typecomplete_len148_score12_95Mucin/PF01456_17/0_17Med3/PF11593_8/1_3MGC24/PF05283_11/6_NODE_2990_length_924_cov_48_242938_g2343_i0109552